MKTSNKEKKLWRAGTFFTFLFSLFVFLSCSNDDTITDTRHVPVQFAAGNIAMPKTTGGGDKWVAGDEIGIFMIKNGRILYRGTTVEGAYNISYAASNLYNDDKTADFSPSGSTTVYYPVDETQKVDFLAYYPYNTQFNTESSFEISVSDQTNPEDIDFLYAYTNANFDHNGYDKNSGTVDLQFNHVMSKLSFTLTPRTGQPALTGAKVEIEGIYSNGRFDLQYGVARHQAPQDLTITANTAANGLTSSAIMIPQTLSGTKLIVTLADTKSKFEWTFTTTKWEAGKNYPYNITVDRTGITVTTGNITDWTGTGDNPTEGIGGTFYKVGDYYPDPKATTPDNGITWTGTKPIGIVFWVDPADSRHGKVVGLKEKNEVKWANSFSNINARDKGNGRNNMKTIKTLSSDFDGYPAFAWVHGMNDANEDYSNANATGIWYLPAIDELQYIYCAWNGKEPTKWRIYEVPTWEPDNSARGNFNSKLTTAGGTTLSNAWYWSSSEHDPSFGLIVDFAAGVTSNVYKYNVYNSARCVLAF